MTRLDEALPLVTPQARVVGLWKRLHGLPGIGPMMGQQLMAMVTACQKQMLEETDPVIVNDITRYVRGVLLLCHAELVHEAAILDQMEAMINQGPSE